MAIHFYLNPETGEPHVLDHGVTEEEALDVLSSRREFRRGEGGTRIVEGRTSEGRLLRVVYTTREDGSMLVISAYPLNPKQAAAFRHRERNR